MWQRFVCRDGVASAPAASVSNRKEMKGDLHSGGTLGSRGTPERWMWAVCLGKQGCLCLLCQEGHVPPSSGMLESCGIVGSCCSMCDGEVLEGPWGRGQSSWVRQGLELGWIIDCLKSRVGRR